MVLVLETGVYIVNFDHSPQPSQINFFPTTKKLSVGGSPPPAILSPKKIHFKAFSPGMRIRSDPLISGPPDPDQLLFSLDPESYLCNTFIKLFELEKNI